MSEEIKKGEFTSKYALGEIVEMKQGATRTEARGFSAEVRAVIFALDEQPAYLVRHWDGRMLQFQENELCVLGVDFEDVIHPQVDA